jgi:hypothetical protein
MLQPLQAGSFALGVFKRGTAAAAVASRRSALRQDGIDLFKPTSGRLCAHTVVWNNVV